MADSIESQIKELADLSLVQQRFVSDVSHELRTPLTTIRMAADVIYEDRSDLDAPTARAVELLQNQLDRFEALLVDLLEISRFDAGAAVLDAERTDLLGLVQRTIDAAAPLAERQGLDVRLVTAEDAVVTAGYRVAGGEPAFPAGILIGQVARVKPDPAGLETYVTIRPAVDFATLDIVLVVLSTGVA